MTNYTVYTVEEFNQIFELLVEQTKNKKIEWNPTGLKGIYGTFLGEKFYVRLYASELNTTGDETVKNGECCIEINDVLYRVSDQNKERILEAINPPEYENIFDILRNL